MTTSARQGMAPEEPGAPPEGTVEAWAWAYLRSTDLAYKLAPPAPPSRWEESPPPRRLAAPGRPPELVASTRKMKTPGPVALRAPTRRGQLVHTFLHHELQAAELMAWALLAFVDTPPEFRAGLVRIMRDEVRHMGLYGQHLAALGVAFGAHPVRDWFWERVPLCANPAQFVATIGIGLEGANLDHAARFAERFLAVEDALGAEVQEQIAREEIPHVQFALRWFRHWTGRDDFTTWAAHLPPPLSPTLMRGATVQRDLRARAGMSEAFLDELEAWQGAPAGS